LSADGDEFIGFYEDDKKQGLGKWHHRPSHIYIMGEWKNNLPTSKKAESGLSSLLRSRSRFLPFFILSFLIR
jgi:hypothetical protein